MIKTAATMGYQYNEQDGHITERVKDFYESLARGGIGLIIVEGGAIDYPLGAVGTFGFRIDNDEYISGWSELVQVIHKQNCPVFAHLLHAGPWHQSRISGLQPVASSSYIGVSEHGEANPVRELTISEIEDTVVKFVSAAERYQKAGFDGLEINASASHLLNTFLSRAYNKRRDAYGCENLESRSRIVTEILREIKKYLGQDFPVTVLINGAEYGVDNGITPEESQEFARIFQKVGADCIHVRASGEGKYLNMQYPEVIFFPEPRKPLGEMLDGSRHGLGALVPLAAAVKKSVSIPVIAVGGLNPKLGEKVLRDGRADFIGLTKSLLADPDLPNKVASGRLEDIAPCTHCQTCISLRILKQPIRCRINAALGREREYAIKQAVKKKRVMVVGGGPAGMEAARVAALRGHEVTLYERGHKLGGLLPLAALVKGIEIEDIPALIRYLRIQIKKLGVKIKYGKDVNLSSYKEFAQDVIILAKGGISIPPELPGINKGIVLSSLDLHHSLKILLRFFNPRVLRWLTQFWMPLGRKIIIIGSGIQGYHLTEFLVKRGREVTLVDTSEALGDGLVEIWKAPFFEWLAERRVTLMTDVKCDEITDKGLTIITKEGKRQTIEADTVVVASPLTPNTELLKSLEGKVPEIYSIGDCKEPHLIVDAIAEGSRIARII